MPYARKRHALFIQYTNPAGYPPLEHAIEILLKHGWSVHCIGVSAEGGAAALALPNHPRLTVELQRRPPPGALQKLQYAAFCLRAAWLALTERPAVAYASDPMASPAALAALALGVPAVVYHEHDAPSQSVSSFQRLVLYLRDGICRKANWVVVPNHERAVDLVTTTGANPDRALTVFNCPSRREVVEPSSQALPQPSAEGAPFRLYFHGSIVPDRLPLTVIDALAMLPSNVVLRFAGYETVGSTGHTQQILARARALGVEHRVEAMGAIPDRGALLALARECHLGLSLMPPTSDDINMRHMVGASNKPFDYLACGCPLIVSNLEDWVHMYVDPGLAAPCDPGSAESIALAVTYWLADSECYREARQAGLNRIAADWNYEAQFEPLLKRLNRTGRA